MDNVFFFFVLFWVKEPLDQDFERQSPKRIKERPSCSWSLFSPPRPSFLLSLLWASWDWCPFWEDYRFLCQNITVAIAGTNSSLNWPESPAPAQAYITRTMKFYKELLRCENLKGCFKIASSKRASWCLWGIENTL